MRILGISCFYHDSAAAFIEDDKILFAIQEERLSRIKHDNSFPENSIEYGLKYLNWDINDIDLIVFYENPDLKFKRILWQIQNGWPGSKDIYEFYLPEFYKNKYPVKKIIKEKLNFKNQIEISEHHLSHAASSFYVSDFDEAIVLTVDGVGEFDTLAIYHGKNNGLKKISSIEFPHSLGLFYSTFTDYLGFEVNEGEYKVMGLAPYGKPVYSDKIIPEIIRFGANGTFELNLDYFNFNGLERHYTDKLIDYLGISPRNNKMKITQQHKDLAASVQKALELTLEHILSHILEQHKINNICMAGGVALNCTSNSNLIRKFGINLFIQPAAGDSGGALGSALYYGIQNHKSKYFFNPYLGISYDENIESFLSDNNIKFSKMENLEHFIADKLSDGSIFGIMQSRDEWGPRALGNRSILADPRTSEMKDHLNEKIKFRESFRPFAPMVLSEDYSNYYETLNMRESPYMLFTHKSLQPEKTAATTHVDNTSRVQTVKKEDNLFVYNILCNFKELTGLPVLTNTSFNLKGEPIVSSPKDALKTFYNSGMDYLVLGKCLIKK